MFLWNKKIRRILIDIVIVFLFFIALEQNAYKFIYYPTDIDYGLNPGNQSLPYDDVYFDSIDGTRLHGWFVPAVTDGVQPAKATVLYVHGNAQNITSHWIFVDWLPLQGFNVFAFDYRGFGQSKGKEEPRGLLEDTQSAINYLSLRPDVDASKLVVYAQSLGGNNSIAAIGDALEQLALFKLNDDKAEQNQSDKMLITSRKNFLERVVNVKALFVDSTFYSYPSVANDNIPGTGIFFIVSLKPPPREVVIVPVRL